MQKIDLPIDIEKWDRTTPSNPDFSWMWIMLGILLWVFVVWYACFWIFSYLIISYFPIEKEIEFFNEFINFNEDLEKLDENQIETKIEEVSKYNFYVSDSSEVNAYATLWWNILVNKWLIENLKYEEELVFILFHEIHHIENRDVLRWILRDIPFSVMLRILWFDIDLQIANLSDIAKSYTDKKIELEADNNAIQIMNELWLNINCAINFFEDDDYKFIKYLNFIWSHPTNEARIKNIEEKNKNPEKDCTLLEYEF